MDVRAENWVESPCILSRGSSRCRDGGGERRAPVARFRDTHRSACGGGRLGKGEIKEAQKENGVKTPDFFQPPFFSVTA